MLNIYRNPRPFKLECGAVLQNLEIAYHTYGELNERGDNAVWVCHALTANSDVAECREDSSTLHGISPCAPTL